MRSSRLQIIPVVAALLSAGCSAHFDPRMSAENLTKAGLPTVKDTIRGVEVSVEEFASPHKSRKAFDAEVARHGVLPLLIRVENRGSEAYRLRRDQVKASLAGQPLQPLYGFEAASQGAARDYVWNALVNTAAAGPLAMFFWPATMAGTANQTQSINRKVEHHFESLELNDILLKPGESAAGFVYFSIPRKSQSLEAVTAEIALEVSENENGSSKPIRFQFAVPPLKLSSN